MFSYFVHIITLPSLSAELTHVDHKPKFNFLIEPPLSNISSSPGNDVSEDRSASNTSDSMSGDRGASHTSDSMSENRSASQTSDSSANIYREHCITLLIGSILASCFLIFLDDLTCNRLW